MATHLSIEALGISEATELAVMEHGDPPVSLGDVGIDVAGPIQQKTFEFNPGGLDI
ncbi:MAG: hypothetical protein AAF549_08340 [Pseudomonadota bacterium]